MDTGDSILDLETAIFVLQRKDEGTGEWMTSPTHMYTGKSDAKIALLRQRKETPKEEWRSVLKKEAERYREGWKDAMSYIDREFELEPESADTQNSSGKGVVSSSWSSSRGSRR